MSLKIYDIVRFNQFPYENDEFMIVADKETPFNFASATEPMKQIFVEEGKDFILLKKFKDGYQNLKQFPNGLQVTESQITFLRGQK